MYILYIFYSRIWSNASRYLKYIKFFFNFLYFKWFKLRTYLKSRLGIGFGGSKLLYSRRRNNIPIAYIPLVNYKLFTHLPSIAVAFIHYGYFCEYTTLFYQSTGLYFTVNLINKTLFNYYMFNKNLMYSLVNSVTYIFYLGFLHVNDLIYFISDLITCQIILARSYGSYAKIIAIDEFTNFFLIKLPSQKRILFFVLTNVLLYQNVEYLEKFNHQKAGFYQNRTRRSIVRGVAMNPVDHPHGGRTKTIRCPLTPWGWPTK